MALVTGGTSGSGGLGSSVLLYDFTVAGADKASIDTGVDTPDAGSAGTSAFAALRMLEIFIIARTDNVASTSAVLTTLNNDSGANYDLVRLTGTTGSAPTAQAAASAAGTSMAFVAHGSGGGASYAAALAFWIPAYAGTTFFKSVLSFQGVLDTTTTTSQAEERVYSWNNTAAVTRVKIAGNGADKLKVGSRMMIYAR
jgi:hypothetical protein